MSGIQYESNILCEKIPPFSSSFAKDDGEGLLNVIPVVHGWESGSDGARLRKPQSLLLSCGNIGVITHTLPEEYSALLFLPQQSCDQRVPIHTR
jgi:hypothetical protein